MYCVYYKSIPRNTKIKNDDVRMKYTKFLKSITTSDGFTRSLANLSRHNKHQEKTLVSIILDVNLYFK